jgi:YVTN family beta-propeller protein
MRGVGRAAALALLATLGACGAEPPAPNPGASPTVAREPAGPQLFVTNERSGDLTVVDLATNAVVATIPLGKRPRGIRVSPDARTLYVALSGSPIAPPGVDEKTLPPPDRSADGIGVVDVRERKLVRTIHAGTDPEQLAVSRDGARLFIANEDAALASVVDVAAGRVVATVPVGGEPEGVDLRPDGAVVYVTSEEDGEVFAIDTANPAVLAKFAVEPRPRSTAFLPDGSRAYVTCENGGSVAIVDARKHVVLRHVKLEGESVRPMGAVASPDGRYVYVTTGRGRRLVAIDTSTDRPVWSVEVGTRPWGIAVSPDGGTLYTANGPSNDVAIVDVASRAVRARVAAGDSPWGVAIVSP